MKFDLKSRLSLVAVPLAIAGIFAAPAIRTHADDKLKNTKEIMEKLHKGKDSAVNTVIAGKDEP